LQREHVSVLVRRYIARVKQYRELSFEQEAHLIDLWVAGDGKALQELILSSLRYVYPAQREAYSYYQRRDYWQALRELIGAGNEGLMLAVKRFKPGRGALFRTAAQHSIRKEIIRQAKLDRSPATRPYDVTLPRGTRLDALRGGDDAEINIPAGPLHPHRRACIIPTDGKHPRSESFSQVLAKGYARIGVDDDEACLNRKIWVAVRRLRHERPALPTRLKVIARDVGCSDARISQITGKTGQKIYGAVMSEESERRVKRFPTWRTNDDAEVVDWCDQLPKKLPGETRAEWHERRKKYRDQLIADWHAASDHNIKRIAALQGDIPAELRFTTPDGYSPAAHMVQLIEWRQAAAKQDVEQAARRQGLGVSR
jgi:hypothetical protein